MIDGGENNGLCYFETCFQPVPWDDTDGTDAYTSCASSENTGPVTPGMGWLQTSGGLWVQSADPTKYVLIVVVLCEKGYIVTPVEGVFVHVAVANVTVEFDSLCVEEQVCESYMVPCDYC